MNGSLCVCVGVCLCVCGAYGKTLSRSAVSHTPASQIELALTAHSASRVYLCVHSGHQVVGWQAGRPAGKQAVCFPVHVCVKQKGWVRVAGVSLPEIN